jgi:hypothetical protein
VAADGRFTPIGGETCALNPPRTDCAEASAEMERLHWSFINALYNTDVIDGWQSGGCLPEVKRRLGYRFSLTELKYSQSVRPGGVLEVSANIDNSGYASLFNARQVHVVIDDGTTRLVAPLASVDPRRWPSGAQNVNVSARLRVPANVAPGTYRLALWLPDASDSIRDRSEYAVRFANEDVWEPASGLNVLVEDLTIDPNAPGDSDPSALEFVELTP